jgi:competence protein ComEA
LGIAQALCVTAARLFYPLKNNLMHDTHFLQFSKKERRGIAALLVIFLVVWVFPSLYERFFLSPQSPDTEGFILRWQSSHSLDSANLQSSGSVSETERRAEAAVKPQLFPFDPNTLDEAGWRRLGLKPGQIRTLLRYRSKGGKFRKPEDLLRIYGLAPGQAEQLIPYVEIGGQEKSQAPFLSQPSNTSDSSRWRPSRKPGPRILDINEADSSAFETLPGIGPVLARRLVNFRDKLGGFYSIDQVRETFGMPDSTYQRIQPLLVVKDPVLRKIDINTATAEELSLHPYINRRAAREILSFRQAHGAFSGPDPLARIQALDPATRIKLIPYLNVSSNK